MGYICSTQSENCATQSENPQEWYHAQCDDIPKTVFSSKQELLAQVVCRLVLTFVIVLMLVFALLSVVIVHPVCKSIDCVTNLQIAQQSADWLPI